jgi:HPt (histidine-containing phosphotransfer) domain-containing protein
MNQPPKPSALQELRAAYLQSLPKKMTMIADSLAARDFKVIAGLAHQLKGSGLSYGFPAVSDLALRLEEAAENRRVPVIESLIIEFRDLTETLAHSAMTSENA